MNINDLAKEAGLETWDTAVPCNWMMEGIKRTGLCMGAVVWCYDGPGTFGAPVALDDEGRAFLAALEPTELISS